MKARGRKPSAFIVFESLETPMKHEARVFEIQQKISLNCHLNKFLNSNTRECDSNTQLLP